MNLKHVLLLLINVTGIPHYVLIDKNGIIADNNAPRLFQLDLETGKNVIDLLLK